MQRRCSVGKVTAYGRREDPFQIASPLCANEDALGPAYDVPRRSPHVAPPSEIETLTSDIKPADVDSSTGSLRCECYMYQRESTLKLILTLAAFALVRNYCHAQQYGGRISALSSFGTNSFMGDVNGDGVIDLVSSTIGQSPMNTELLLGDRTGAFSSAGAFQGFFGSVNPILADLNGDGAVEILALSNSFIGSYFWSGSVGLTAAGILIPGFNPISGIAGDLTGDGFDDLAVLSNSAFNPISTYLGDGAGGFSLIANPLGGGAKSMAIGDFNGDGNLDLANGGYGSGFYIFTGNGAGSLAPWFASNTVPMNDSFIVLDANNDGLSDFAIVSNSIAFPYSVLLSTATASGGFAPPVTFPTNPGSDQLSIGQFNSDGDTDILLPSSLGITVHLGASGAIFGIPIETPTQLVGIGSAQNYAVGDVDSDGDDDLVQSLQNNAICLLCDGSGRFTPRTSVVGLHQPRAVATGDINLDGFPDLVSADSNDLQTASIAGIFLARGDGTGGLENPSKTYLPTGGIDSIAIGDITNDGLLDVTALLWGNNTSNKDFAVLPGSSSSVWGTPILLNAGNGALNNLTGSDQSLTLADVNSDGSLDILAIRRGATNKIVVLPSNGLGGFGPHSTWTLPTGNVGGLATADLNGDGNLDIVAPTNNPNRVTSLMGDGSAFFPTSITSNIGIAPEIINPGSLHCGRIDNDLDIDIVIIGPQLLGSSPVVSSVAFLTNDGSGAFSLPTTLTPAGPGASSIVASDLDGDGKLDIASADVTGVYILRGLGSYQLGSPMGHIAGVQPRSIMISDFNCDGSPDLATSDYGYISPSCCYSGISVLMSQRSAPIGIAAYGTGSPGCNGIVALGASSSPAIGNNSFSLVCTNTPASQLGIGIVSDAQDLGGTDSLGIGALLHIGLFTAGTVYALDVTSDVNGIAQSAVISIPLNPALVGSQYFAQFVFVEPEGYRCTSSSIGISTSYGVSLTIG